MGLIFKDIADSISDVDLRTNTIKGYASVFGNEDSDGDIIVKNSYIKTVNDWGPSGKARIKHCWQHDITDPFLKTTELYEDSHGLAFISTVPDEVKDVQYIQDRIKLIQAGLVDEVSVGIIPVRHDRKDGIRHITECKLFEYSSVTLASNELAKITSIKGINSAENILFKLKKKSEAIAALFKNGDVTDDCFFMLEYYHEQLLKHISDLLTPSKDTLDLAPSNDTQDKNKADIQLIKSTIINSFKNGN